MPTSNLSVAPFVINLVERYVPHDRVLDIGPGWGKYATLLREYLNVKPSRVDAVEAWPAYIRHHRLERLYDVVWLGDAAGDQWSTPSESATVDAGAQLALYDTVLMVDVIEHMRPEQARRVIDRCPQARVIICTPVEFFHNGPGLPPTEDHVSHWTPEALQALGRPTEWLGTEHGALLARLGPA